MVKILKKMPFHPLFLLFALYIFIMGYGLLFFTYFFSVLIHEFGHAFVARKLGYKLNKMYFAPYGVSLNYKESVFKTDDEILIALSGPCLNLIICICSIALWWIFPFTFIFTIDLVFCNFMLALFNFLPAYPLDGGRVFVATMSKYIDRTKAYKLSRFFNYILCIVFFAGFVISIFFKVNITLGLVVVFLIGGIIESKFESKYEALRFEKRRDYKKGLKVSSRAFASNVPICKIIPKLSKLKYNIIYVIFSDGKVKTINEEVLEKISLNYSLDKSFDDILLKK